VGDYAAVNGISMYYEVHGDGGDGGGGPPIVLLHGGLLTIDLSFGPLIPALAEYRKVIAVELQGHGRTADTDRPMCLGSLSDDVVLLLDELGIGQADLLGYSLGAAVAIDFALRYPERLGQMVLASIDYRPGEGELDKARMPTAADFQGMRDAYAAVAPDPSHFDEFAAKASGMVHAMPGWTDEELRSIAAPTLLIFGDRDFAPMSHAVAMAELMPAAQLAILPGTTHMGVMRSPALVVPMLMEFLTSTGI
jgi:pimeloyl-ACP methyl ester carboxylesterase